MNDADRIRRNMGQRPDRYFDLCYLQSIVAQIDRHIACQSHNAMAMRELPTPRFPCDHWRYNLLFEAMEQREADMQQLEQLLSEIELHYQWGYFPFQRESC